MEAGEADRGSPSWESLPLPVLARCLRATPPRENSSTLSAAFTKEEFAAFCTCKAFAEALLASGPKTRIKIDLHGRSQASFKRLVALLRWAAPCCATLRMDLNGASADDRTSSLRPLLDQLHQRKRGLTLPMLTSIHCYGVVLDTRPGSLAAVCPNLQQLHFCNCAIPSGSLPLAQCTRLSKLVLTEIGCSHYKRESWPSRLLRWLHGRPPLIERPSPWLPQLQQLASLPTLASLTITDQAVAAPILPLVSGQLTQLHLSNWGEDSVQFSAALAGARQCTNLRRLEMGACTAEQLGVLTALTKLQHLLIRNGPKSSVGDGDGLVSTLLRFPHLTSLHLSRLGIPQQSYADSPCSWKQLKLSDAAPQLLARLPLHSLVQPLEYDRLYLDQPGLTVADVQAAVNNLARCGQVPRLRQYWLRHDEMGIIFAPADFAAAAQPAIRAALLRAAAPLLPRGIDRLAVSDAGLVKALQQAVPYNISYISSWGGFVDPSFWPQLAHSFPQLKQLQLCKTKPGLCSTAEVMSYIMAACARHSASGQPGVPRVADIKFTVTGYYGQWFDQWQQTLQEVKGAVEALGLQARVTIV